jgi:putative glutamine amidotransferase
VGKRVVVTGSSKGSSVPFSFIKLILSFYNIKPLFITPKKKIPKDFDALLISGGIDICPNSYNSNLTIAKCDKKRDILELELLQKAYSKSLPIFGICRGMQIINIFFKGTLYPDIKDIDLNRPHPKSPFPINNIEILPNTRLYSILQTTKLKVNALHHQAIKTLGENLIISAKDKNGIIQAIEHKKHFILGVQWHPEFMPYSLLQRKLFKSFINQIVI